jgi:hypothetical protein
MVVAQLPLSVLADDSDVGQALREYHSQKYLKAISHLGASLPTEFSNPTIHYYMANCMVYLRQRNDAIREYRIAYALDPTGTTGKYSKMCLNLFGIDAEGKIPKKKEEGPSGSGDPAAPAASKKELSSDSQKVLEEMVQQKKEGSCLYVRNYGPEDFAKHPGESEHERENRATWKDIATQAGTLGADGLKVGPGTVNGEQGSASETVNSKRGSNQVASERLGADAAAAASPAMTRRRSQSSPHRFAEQAGYLPAGNPVTARAKAPTTVHTSYLGSSGQSLNEKPVPIASKTQEKNVSRDSDSLQNRLFEWMSSWTRQLRTSPWARQLRISP